MFGCLVQWNKMYEYRAKVIKVIDGDTIDVDIDLGFGVILAKQRIRLYGIDTPESRTSDKVEKFYGKLSSAFMKERCPRGSYITLRTYLDSKGKYGRILGEIIVDDINLNKLMVEKSLAVEYNGRSKKEIQLEHQVNRMNLNREGRKYS